MKRLKHVDTNQPEPSKLSKTEKRVIKKQVKGEITVLLEKVAEIEPTQKEEVLDDVPVTPADVVTEIAQDEKFLKESSKIVGPEKTNVVRKLAKGINAKRKIFTSIFKKKFQKN